MSLNSLMGSRATIISDIYDYALSAMYRNGYRLYDPSYPMAHEEDIWNVFRRDPIILAAIEQMLSGIVCRGWTCVADGERPIDKTAARVMRDLIKKINGFTSARRELACARILGRAYQYIEGERQWIRVSDSPLRLNWWVPLRLRDVDRRRVHYKPVAIPQAPAIPEKYGVVMMLWNVARGNWAPLDDPAHFVKLIVSDEEGRLGYGHGLMEAMYFYLYAKGIALKEDLQGLKRYAQGLPIVGIDGARSADTNTPNDVVVQSWLEAFETMQAKDGIVYDKQDVFNVLWPTGAGHTQIFDNLEYFDSALTRLITGSIRPSGGAVRATGHGGQAETEAETSASIYDYYREVVDEVLTRDLISLVWRQNAINFRLLGLAEANCPKFMSTEKPNENAIETLQVLTGARRDLKLEVLTSEAYEKLRLTRPSPGDETLGPLEDAQPYRSRFPAHWKPSRSRRMDDAFRLEMDHRAYRRDRVRHLRGAGIRRERDRGTEDAEAVVRC